MSWIYSTTILIQAGAGIIILIIGKKAMIPMDAIAPSHVYVVMEKPYGMHHFKLACVYIDRSSAERYVRNLYDDVVHMSELQRPGLTTYLARMPKSGKEITIRIVKEPLRSNPHSRKTEESQNEKETHG